MGMSISPITSRRVPSKARTTLELGFKCDALKASKWKVQTEWNHETSFQTIANNQPTLTNQHNNSLFPLSNQHAFKALFVNYSQIPPLLSHRELHANPPQTHPIANSFSLPKTATFTTVADSPSKNHSHKPASS